MISNTTAATSSQAAASDFTPGPWHVTGTDQILAGETGCARFVASAYAVDCSTTERAANARLISAAPEMYEALLEIIRFVDSVGSEHINRVPFAAARAALAKAEGAR